MNEAEIIAAIRREHLKANIAHFEGNDTAVIHWERAWVDPGGTIFGPGPYAKVPMTWGDEETVQRVYPTARVRRRIITELVRPTGAAPTR